MKTFKQTITESAAGDDLLDIKLRLGEWWKANGSKPYLMKHKKELTDLFNTALRNIDEAVDIVYENTPER